ncbi:MAG: alkaline phosphatase family protein [Peptococcaceae bacterium]
MLKRDALAKKIMVLGVDGMDPRLTAKFVKEGKMPNVKKLMEKGSCREDLVLLGANPTVTPPMWTTLSTGAYPMTHGITGFFRHSHEDLDVMQYNLDSRNCTAEQLWDVFVEAGKKTLVWHWPGSSWPPTSDNPLLYVVDGTQPGCVGMGTAQVEQEFILGASEKNEAVTYINNYTGDVSAPCVITDLAPTQTGGGFDEDAVMGGGDTKTMVLGYGDGSKSCELPINIAQSYIKPATGWSAAPADAKEFIMLLSKGLVRRPCLILKNEDGIYDSVAIYKSKKETEPIAVLKMGKIYPCIQDIAIKGEEHYDVIRNMRLLKLTEDGSELKMWVSAANNIHDDSVFHPRSLYKTIVDNIGYPQPGTMIGEHEIDLVTDCRLANWDLAADWQSSCINYLIENEDFDVIFSHFHNVDLEMHKIVHYLTDKGFNKQPEEVYMKFTEDVYKQTDYYIGKYMHLLDEDWTIILVSDHAQGCPQHEPPFLGDCNAISIRVMQELGFTALKHDKNGNELREIDWENTKAIAIRENDIYLNIKGRDKYGIVDPEDQYEVEEDIMTALYGYRHPDTGKRCVALALRNKDAAVLGMGGPENGDIIYFVAEGYNYDHADSLSTTLGTHDTSLSPIFIGAGPGFKENHRTNRVLRQVDVAPTMAVLGGVRMPHECEGAPMYSILTEEF